MGKFRCAFVNAPMNFLLGIAEALRWKSDTGSRSFFDRPTCGAHNLKQPKAHVSLALQYLAEVKDVARQSRKHVCLISSSTTSDCMTPLRVLRFGSCALQSQGIRTRSHPKLVTSVVRSEQAVCSTTRTCIMQLSFSFAHGGSHGPLVFEPHIRIDDVAHHLKRSLKQSEQVYARFLWDGTWLPAGQKLSETSVKDGDVLETLWVSAVPLGDIGNDVHEVLPRRAPLDWSAVDGLTLDVAGIFQIERHLDQLQKSIVPSLQVLDIRQCGLRPEFIRSLFEQLPATLKELRASRNKIGPDALECLGNGDFKLRVFDIGYSHCSSCAALSGIGGILSGTLEELGVGDLQSATRPSTLLAGILASCPRLKVIDLTFNTDRGFLDETFKSLAEHCPLIEAVYAYHTEPTASVLHECLSGCQNLAHLEVGGISQPETIRSMAQLPSLKALRLEVFSSQQDMVDALCSLKVETLFLEFTANVETDDDEDDIEDVLDLNLNPEALAEAFGKSTASCFSLAVGGAVDPMILQSIGSRLHEFGPGRSHGEGVSILDTLLQAPNCCVNLMRLEVCYHEQIKAETLAEVAEMCPQLMHLQLNADDHDFQMMPIDNGVLALGRYCGMLEHLESWALIIH